MIEIVFWDEDGVDDHGVSRFIEPSLGINATVNEVSDAIDTHLNGSIGEEDFSRPDATYSCRPVMPEYMSTVHLFACTWRSTQGWTVIREMKEF